MYDFARVTADLDVIEVRGGDPAALAAIAGKGSELHRRHKVFLDIVMRAVNAAIAHPGTVTFPDDLIPTTTNA
jgi:hypothetical protein